MADVRERLERRNEERLAAIEKRKADKESKEQPSENVEYITSTFSKEKREIDEQLCKSATLIEAGNKMKAVEFFDMLSEKCQKLQKFVADSAMFLPSRDIQVLQETVKTLQQDINEKREEYLPKKKFAFKARKKEAPNKDGPVIQETKNKEFPLPATEKKLLDSGLGFLGVADQTLTMDQSQVKNQDITLRNLQNCTVIIYGAPSALLMNKLMGCTILCGPVSGAVFIEDCVKCDFVFPCHQLRVHCTTDSKFYLHVTSRAIVEDCSNVGFAPFNWEYENLQNDFKLAGLDPLENNWSLVNDFNWLKADVPSPNWFIISEGERIHKWSM
ncbi:tubulin-specific chaperone C-like [Stylophora pistillata]|uniref:Tubulin-specific chaperone C n=1 Tax=Stylophora pistillata TaxID=50429 RepID=A0A2B4S834_STYPI|nr:tubulin-specific chaperone C-like [Stylophora pistillata]PFX26051.1 Tubulin-specific chaperone C [Stylophora pistillata]